MSTLEQAAALAIALAKQRALAFVGPDELLLAALQSISRFGIVLLGPLTIDLEGLGLDWMTPAEKDSNKVAYSPAVVALFDAAAQIAKADNAATVGVDHLLVAFAPSGTGLMLQIKQNHKLTSSSWRAAVTQLAVTAPSQAFPSLEPRAEPSNRDFLTPEQAAEALGIHVQTLRGYVRSGKMPALRLAGERALRIRRTDLESVLEPLGPAASFPN